MHPLSPSLSNKPVIFWLLGTCFLVWLMIMLGGATRLTHAGLSIVEWKPVTGIIPPLNKEQWIEEFRRYKQFPEYRQVNWGMNMQEFQFIYFMEYAHRLLGRLIGLWFALPALFFWKTNRLAPILQKRVPAILGLGLAQGFLGWYMVKSGLTKDPTVSHYRLTAHLLLAVGLYGVILWTAFELLNPEKRCLASPEIIKIRHLSFCCSIMLGLTILYGGLVAGLKAGLIYNTFPLMEKRFLPEEWNFYHPFWKNLLENPALVQWVHRWLGLTSLVLIILTTGKILISPTHKKLRVTALCWSGMAVFQIILGILTLLFHVPVIPAIIHQGNAIVVVSLGLYIMHQTKRVPKNR